MRWNGARSGSGFHATRRRKMISNIRNLNPYSYNVSSSGASGKLFVPVNPSSVIYAQFNHISGIAAKEGQHGVSISKIQILNTLIDNLSRIKSNPNTQKAIQISEEQADALIKNYQQQIEQTVRTSQAAFMLSGARPSAGALFSIDA